MIDNRELMFLLTRIAKALEGIDQSLEELKIPKFRDDISKEQWEKLTEAPVKCEVTE